MKEIYDTQQIKSALERASIPDGIYINVNLSDSGKSPNQRAGLDKAKEFIGQGERPVVILYSFESPFNLFQDKRFMDVMSLKRVHFLRCPFMLKEIGDIVSLPTHYNIGLFMASKETEKQDLLGVIRHNYHSNPQENIERARKELGIKGSDEDVAYVLQNYQARISSLGLRMGATIIPGTFCDIEGTLLVNDEINTDVLKMLIDYSQTSAINFWTGADVKEIAKRVGSKLEKACSAYEQESGTRTNLHLRTPILSKQMFAGVKPYRVIDDLSLSELQEQYRFQEPLEYIKV